MNNSIKHVQEVKKIAGSWKQEYVRRKLDTGFLIFDP